MIERAERYVSAQEVRPGDRVIVDGHHIDVESTTLRTEDVVLTGAPVGRTSGSKRKVHVTVAHKTSVTVLADARSLDEIEARISEVLAEVCPSGVTIDDDSLQVTDESDVVWSIPLRAGGGATVHHMPAADAEEAG